MLFLISWLYKIFVTYLFDTFLFFVICTHWKYGVWRGKIRWSYIAAINISQIFVFLIFFPIGNILCPLLFLDYVLYISFIKYLINKHVLCFRKKNTDLGQVELNIPSKGNAEWYSWWRDVFSCSYSTGCCKIWAKNHDMLTSSVCLKWKNNCDYHYFFSVSVNTTNVTPQ